MTVAIAPPFIHVEDANGNPYVGSKLYVYLVNTTTLASIYSDEALSVSVANPLTSDAAGNFIRVYIAAGQYKLRAETSTGVLIWQWDDIDTNLGTGGVLGIASGGTSATTAASARTALGAASQSDVDDLSADFTALAASFQKIASAPQGRLTLTTAMPVLGADVTAATSVFYTLYVGNQCPIWDGTQYNLTAFTELTLSLVASHTANAIYDVFIWLEGSSVTIGTGPAWVTATAGSGARGSGAGTTELERKNGLWTNKNSMTTRNGATTYTVAANRGTYVGSIFMDGTNGQISCHVAYGQSRKWGVWNAYNRVPISLVGGDPTASWSYSTATIRASNGDANNKVTVFSGLAEEFYNLRFIQNLRNSVAPANTGEMQNGIGYNSTTVFSGTVGDHYIVSSSTSTVTSGSTVTALYIAPPSIGINNVQACENVPNTGGSETLFGTDTYMKLTAAWRG